MNALTLIPALVLIAVLYVLVPVAAAVFAHYRNGTRLRCPVTDRNALVLVDARRAAVGEVFGRPSLQAKSCSLWPEQRGCAQACLTGAEHEWRAPDRGVAV